MNWKPLINGAIGAGIMLLAVLTYENWSAVKFAARQIDWGSITESVSKHVDSVKKTVLPTPSVPQPKPAPVAEAPVEQPTEDAPVDPNAKQWVSGANIEWRVPEGMNHIYLKYKEKNGRLIMEYDFKVKEGERFELKAVRE